MQKNKLLVIILVIIAVGAVAWLLLAGQKNDDAPDRLTIGATIFPLYDIVRNIAGDEATVVQILPAGSSPHTFELTPAVIKALDNARIVFKIGNGADDWADDITDSLSGVTVTAVDSGISLRESSTTDSHNEEEGHDESDGEEHSHGTNDPHYWLSVANAKIIASNVADQLSRIDPDKAERYADNLTDYTATLGNLQASVTDALASIDHPAIVTFHDAYRYFAAEFGIEIAGVFRISAETEPTPQQLAELRKIVDEHHVPALFSEPQLSDDVIKPFADDNNLPIYELDPLGGTRSRQSYIDLIQYNADIIAKAYRQ